jgi:hypothetical protein
MCEQISKSQELPTQVSLVLGQRCIVLQGQFPALLTVLDPRVDVCGGAVDVVHKVHAAIWGLPLLPSNGKLVDVLLNNIPCKVAKDVRCGI